MKMKVRIMIAVFFTGILLSACGEDTALTQFRKSMDDFCTRISEIDTSINSIDAEAENEIGRAHV